jgi:SAM-dependent methyltransferase
MASSFRDPGGLVVHVGERILRIVHKSGEPALESFLASAAARRLLKEGLLVKTERLGGSYTLRLAAGVEKGFLNGESGALFEHERVPFESFPYEWPPDMLYAAGKLTLDLAEGVLGEGFGLKDASPYNVLFRGPKPIFVDLLSFERRAPGDPVWQPYGQFARTFLLPLLVNKHFGLRLDQLLLARREGLEPEEVYRLCGRLQRLRQPFLTLASIPSWLSGRAEKNSSEIYRRRQLADSGRATFILEQLFKRLRRQLEQVKPLNSRASVWTRYVSLTDCLNEDYSSQKIAFVRDVMNEFSPRTVLDVGCNTGRFSHLATRSGASVVAIDQDPAVVGQLWREAEAEQLNILPLVVDLTRPSPSVGWHNRENSAFLKRARRAFDALLMLAVVHHMLVSERIPLPQIIDLAAELTRDLLVIEFVAPADPMFRRLTRGRDHLFVALTNENFKQACLKRFAIVRYIQLPGSSRWVYLLRKR